ncbi:hypothetical protein [Nocardiopsis sp. NPDC006938]|uniref:hypothetical protein n=1 Tax=Nocardiopsis sp. NPDC006938 TaxID=3364337 RepID=UPI00367951F0
MTNTTPASTPARAALLGLAAGAGAALVAEGLGWLVSTGLVATQSDDVVGANIGAGMAGMTVALLVAPALALLLLRLARTPRPLAAVLYSLPLYLLLTMVGTSAAIPLETWLWDRFPGLAAATSPWLPWHLITVLTLAASLALTSLLTSRSRGAGAPARV